MTTAIDTNVIVALWDKEASFLAWQASALADLDDSVKYFGDFRVNPLPRHMAR